jgi:hypothetical protein
VRWLGLVLGFGGLRFGKAMTEGRTGGDCSHQPSFSSRLGSVDRRNWMVMIFAMARRCPADWQSVCPECSGIADFCADFAQMRGHAFRDPSTSLALQEIMITDEY